LDLVVPDADLGRIAQLRDLLRDSRVMVQLPEGLTHHVDVEDLPDVLFQVLADVAEFERLRRARVVTLADHAFRLVAQPIDLRDVGISGTGKTKLAQGIAELIGEDDDDNAGFFPCVPTGGTPSRFSATSTH
jgi:hypothetical protein